jgi:hypothetical protein
LGKKEKCAICDGTIELPFKAMKEWEIDGTLCEWEIDGTLCGKCYSKQLNEYYPGEHVRVNKHLD